MAALEDWPTVGARSQVSPESMAVLSGSMCVQVVVLVSDVEGVRVGCLSTSFSVLGHEAPLVCITVPEGSDFARFARCGEPFGALVLAAGHGEPVARFELTTTLAALTPDSWRELPEGALRADECHAYVRCSPRVVHTYGGCSWVVAELEEALHMSSGGPLLRFNGHYLVVEPPFVIDPDQLYF